MSFATHIVLEIKISKDIATNTHAMELWSMNTNRIQDKTSIRQNDLDSHRRD